MPDLDFQIEGAEILPYAAAPTLLFKLRIENLEGDPVRSVALKTQIRILTMQRRYTNDEQERLVELFGATERWGETLKAMVWAHTTVLVPPFRGPTTVDMAIPCTYDFEVVSAKYFHALEQGAIPLEFLFSGTVFYAGRAGLQVSQISWEKEAHYRLPAALWHEMMNLYFPNSAWLRLRQDVFDRLYSYKTRQGLLTWEDAVERLLRTCEEGMR
ncbi:MAG TPA: DUF6084 family protein [Ktedonobacterales bacterium]